MKENEARELEEQLREAKMRVCFSFNICCYNIKKNSILFQKSVIYTSILYLKQNSISSSAWEIYKEPSSFF